MRLIGTLDNPEHAQRFGDYLLTRGIETSVENADGQWEIWVLDEDRLDEAERELKAFVRDPDHPDYLDARRHSQAIRKEAEKAEKRYRDNFVCATSLFRSGGGPTPLTVTLIAVSIGVTLITGFGDVNNLLTRWFFFAPLIEIDGRLIFDPRGPLGTLQLWRLVSPIFLHLDIIHLFFNMYWLWIFGRMIEGRKGLAVMAGLVLLGAVLPNYAQYLIDHPQFGGMSGVLYALFGYLWVKGKYDPTDGLGLNRQVVVILTIWLVLGFLVFTNIANYAHLGGLVVGAAFAGVAVARKRLRKR